LVKIHGIRRFNDALMNEIVQAVYLYVRDGKTDQNYFKFFFLAERGCVRAGGSAAAIWQ